MTYDSIMHRVIRSVGSTEVLHLPTLLDDSVLVVIEPSIVVY